MIEGVKSILRSLFNRTIGDDFRAAVDRRVSAKVGQLIEPQLAAVQALQVEQQEQLAADLAAQERKMRTEMYALLEQKLATALAEQEAAITRKVLVDKPWKNNIYMAPRELSVTSPRAPFMQFSTCCAADFLHPRFAEISGMLAIPPVFHRKYWEWVFIIHAAINHGLGPGVRALGFGVGTEPLSSAFAKLGATVVGTDAPQEIGIGQGWAQDTISFADTAERLFDGNIVSRALFDRNVSFAVCDMNAIGDQFKDFDFCWSSCCLEHLGSLQHGLDFIINSVEKTLKIGGVACHTTELNLSSNSDTVEEGPTVLYRKRDLDDLVSLLRQRGHRVDDITIAPMTDYIDVYVDTPPFAPPHLKLALAGYTATSVGMTITRGR